MQSLDNSASIAATISFGIALRSIISLHSYSGAGTPPMYGDYEAQRHWQEICINLPASQWYKNSNKNNLSYWGLDYPPLTAYHSLIMGVAARRLNASFIQLRKSRGFESDDHKFFMRLTVLIPDILIYIPALVVAVQAVKRIQCKITLTSGWSCDTFFHLVLCLTYPGQMLIDNGHFQYNNISLGLATIAISLILYDRLVLASLMFSLALNYKQMELYHALPIFVYLLQSCLRKNSFLKVFTELFKISVVVLSVCVLIWWPWIHSVKTIMQVIKRIFPIYRGVFEDKVANFWCAVNVAFKLKNYFTNQQMALICLTMTLATTLPGLINLFQKPSKLSFLYSLFNTSMSFFLFSFQVHEKSILLPAIPAMLLYPFEPFVVLWFLQVSTCSMFPLLMKDNLTIPFIATWLVFYAIAELMFRQKFMMQDIVFHKCIWLYYLSNGFNLILILCNIYAPAPERFPHIYPLLLSVYCCIHFIMFLIYGNVRQFYGRPRIFFS